MLERLFGRRKPVSDVETAPSKGQEPEATQQDTVPAEVPKPAGESSPGIHASELELAMSANVAMDNAETRLKVYQELLFSELLLCLTDESAPKEASSQNPESPKSLNVAILKNQANMQFACAFTSEAAARKWRPQGGHFAGVKGQDIFKILEGSPAEVIVINPGSAPFIVLPKIDYKQLALGVVPQNPTSPVQNPKLAPEPQANATAAQAAGEEDQSGQMQLAFPKDVFNTEQQSFIKTILLLHTNVEAAVYGALKPPGAKENEWIRTIFLRVKGVEQKQEAVQALTTEIRSAILENQALFKETPFEIGVMPDPQFWLAMHQNNLVAIDKNPPPIPKAGSEDELANKPQGIVDAKVTP